MKKIFLLIIIGCMSCSTHNKLSFSRVKDYKVNSRVYKAYSNDIFPKF